MGAYPDALYSDLLQDLSPHLTLHQYIELQCSGKTSWYPDSSLKNVAAVQLGNSFLKKFKDDISPDANAKCLEIFTNVNNKCKEWSLELQTTKDEVLLGELKNSLYNFFYPGGSPLISNFSQILDLGKSGPGSSVAARGDDFYTKFFDSRLSTTKKCLYSAYAAYFDNNHDLTWADAEYLREAQHGDYIVVEGNQVSFVEKNRDVSRLICTEPSLNMFYQLGLGKLLERRLFQVFGIDFEFQQAVNRDLARLGSRRKGKGLVTLDLSSASDSLSIGMMKEVFPPSVVSWLELFRSPVSRLPNGASMQLNMISTMGNGSTFPIQTVLFACVVSAAARCNHLDLVRRDPELDNFPNFGVFGDDIICETIISRDVVRLLTILGFEVHPEKSFFEGPFRESCGGDYFNGHPVRGVYLKTLKEPHNAYPVINRLNLWTAVHGIRVPRTVGRLIKHTKNPYWVPVWENEDAGIRCTESNLRKKRYARKTNSLIYKRWVPRARRLTIKDGYVHVPKGEKSRSYNASGLLVAFLRGDIDGGYITVRQRQVVYSSKTGVTSNWDYAPSKYGVALNWNITPTGSALPADIRLPNFGWAVAVNTAKP